MAKEIEKYFVKRLQSTLLEYLNDFSQNNVAQFSLGLSTNIRLENLSIKKQALLNFQLPMYILDGKISAINLNMPMNYKSQRSEMTIDNIDLTVCAITETGIGSMIKDRNIQGDENLKKHKLKIWEEQMAKYFEALAPPSWIQKIVDGIYDNMSITIKQFTLTFQNYSMFGYETLLKVKCDVSIRATDSNFQDKFNDNAKCAYKTIEIKRLSVSLKGKQPQSKKDDSYILFPIDIQCKLTLNKETDHLKKPLRDIQVRIESPIIFMINKEQKHYLFRLNELLQNLEIIQDNFHLRPQVEIKNNFSEWWKYLINAVMEKQKNHKLDLGYSSRRLVLMKQYIELYKRKQNIILVPWLNTWTLQDETKFQKCERSLSLKDLLKYRQWAFEEIRIEAKRYFHSSKDGSAAQSVKPLLEIWTNTINNQNSFKDQRKGLDQDIPIELEDDEKINLYEILERDKTQVLSSYLKGQNNDPNQVISTFQLDAHSIFLLLIEQRGTTKFNYSPDNTQIFKNCQCYNCLIKLTKRPSQQSDGSPLKHKPTSSKTIADIIQEQKLQKEDNSFHTVKDIDSFLSDLNDLEENKVVEAESVENEPIGKNSQSKWTTEIQKAHRLFLVCSCIGIHSRIKLFQNGKLKTLKKHPFMIQEIKIAAPGMIPTLMVDKVSKGSKHRPTDFLSEIFDITLSREQVFLNSDGCFINLIEFLQTNEMSNVAEFLTLYERDKNYFQDFNIANFDIYDQFFDEKSQYFLHMTTDQQKRTAWNKLQHTLIPSARGENRSLKNWKENKNRHQWLQEIHGRLVELIRKQLFIPYLEDYGDFVFPLCIQNLKDKLTIPHLNNPCFQLQILLEGKKSEYKIKPVQQVNKTNKEQVYKDQSVKSAINIEIQPFYILLSTKGMWSLLDFLDDTKSQILSQNELFITKNHLLLECVLKSRPLNDEIIENEKIKVKLKVMGKMKVRVVSDLITSINKTELKLELTNLEAYTISIPELLHNLPNNQSLLQHHKYHTGQVLKVEQIKIIHKLYNADRRFEEINQNKQQDSEQSSNRQNKNTQQMPQTKQLVLSTQLTIISLISKLRNHALITDNKLYIQIPYFDLEIRDSNICLIELMLIVSRKQQASAGNDYSRRFILSQDSLLKAELQTLYRDHNKETCKHCIIKYKKSTDLTNILIGVMPHYNNSEDYQATWFQQLERLQPIHHKHGLSIKFVNLNRVATKHQNLSLIAFPIIIYTRDQGFFKDNIIVHCTNSIVQHQGIKIENSINQQHPLHSETNYFNIQPQFEVTDDCQLWRKLDEKFIFYFRDLEKRLFKSEFNSGLERDEEKFENEIRSEEFKDQLSNKLYVLFYYHKPLRNNLVKDMEVNVRLRSLKTQIYFQVQKVWVRFQNQFAACTILTTIKNTKYILNVLENIYNSLYGEPQQDSKLKTTKQIIEKQTPIDTLDELMISASVQSLYFCSNHSHLRLCGMSIELNLDLMTQTYQMPNNIKKRNSLMPHQQSEIIIHLKNRQTLGSTLQADQVQDQVIMKCAQIGFNFNKVTLVDVRNINIYRIQHEYITLTLDSIQITNNTISKDYLLIMPDRSQYSSKLPAIQIHIDFSKSYPEIAINIEPARIQLSKQRVDDFLVAINSFYLINLQEAVKLYKYLSEHIFVSKLVLRGQDNIVEVYKMQQQGGKSSNQRYNYVLSMDFSRLAISLSQEANNFFNIQLQSIKLQKKQNQEIKIDIASAELMPNDNQGIYKNLIGNLKQLSIKIEGRCLKIENMQFIMISKYINEIDKFKSMLEQIMLKSREEIAQYQETETHQQKIDEFNMALSDQLPITVRLINCQFILPERSYSKNHIEINVFEGDMIITQNKEQVLVPKLGKCDQKVILVDLEEETEPGYVYFHTAKIILNKVHSTYHLEKLVANQEASKDLFQAQTITITAKSPIFDLDQKNWRIKDSVQVALSGFNMQMDFGKLMMIKGFIDKNTSEESKLFTFDEPLLQKINVQLSIDQMSMGGQRYVQNPQVEKEKQQQSQIRTPRLSMIKQQQTYNFEKKDSNRQQFKSHSPQLSPKGQQQFD